MKLREFLRPGDGLLYRPEGLMGWLIAVKTWRQVSHCEAYVGGGHAVASRGPQDGQGGVELYPLRLESLAHILRPAAPFDLEAASAWFETVRGQRYDFWGLMRFFAIGTQPNDRMFCSEFLMRWYRHGGLEPFQADEDADSVAPGELLLSPMFRHYRVTAGYVTPAHFVEESV